MGASVSAGSSALRTATDSRRRWNAQRTSRAAHARGTSSHTCASVTVWPHQKRGALPPLDTCAADTSAATRSANGGNGAGALANQLVRALAQRGLVPKLALVGLRHLVEARRLAPLHEAGLKIWKKPRN